MISYLELANWLETKGIGSYMQNPDQMVVSGMNPATLGSNCFWVTGRGGEWYIGTWLPACYQLPTDGDIRQVCELVFRSSASAMYTISCYELF